MDLALLPANVTTLDAVPSRYRMAYLEDEAGGFFLDMRIAIVIRDGDNEISKWNRKIEEAAMERAKIEDRQRSDVIHQQLSDEIERAGVNRKLVPAAAALIKESAEFDLDDVEDGTFAVARTPVGIKSLGALVTDFLLSDDGAGFRPPRSAPESNHFAAMVADLRRGR